MERFFLKIAFDGTRFQGWQVQPNGLTVQGTIEDALGKLLGSPERVVTLGCGRTDSGVHAAEFYLSFEAAELPEAVIEKLNGILPQDVAVLGVFKVDREHHVRYDATSRTYQYRVHLRKDPFCRKFSYRLRNTPDIEGMNEAASYLLDYEHFAAFQRTGGSAGTDICDVREAYWSKDAHMLTFTITADRFLRNMVRAVVGTLLEIGRHKAGPEHMKAVIESRDRSAAGPSMPALGLFLTQVEYPYPLEPWPQ